MQRKKTGKIGLIISERKSHHRQGEEQINYVVSIGLRSEKRKNEIFFPSELVEQLINEEKIGFGFIGKCALKVNERKKIIRWQEFYPFEVYDYKSYNYLIGKGLGSIINIAIISKLKKEFPDYAVQHSINLLEKNQNNFFLQFTIFLFPSLSFFPKSFPCLFQF